MNDKNDDLNKTNHHSPLASDNDDGKLMMKVEILKINNLIKNKFHLPKLDQNIKDKFLDIKKSVRKSTRLNSSHTDISRMPSSA